MAQIGYGYGSEFQLLRFLGHHRHKLEELIAEQIGKGTFEWEDFEFANPKNVISGDKEITGLDFLIKQYPLQYERIVKEYKTYIKKKDWQNWDAVFTHNGTLYLVEAKAHISELSSGKEEHGDSSKELILDYFKAQLPCLPVSRVWLQDYYQLANRLATAALLNKHGIKTKVLYIYFINGYRKRVLEKKGRVEVLFETVNLNASEEKFREAIAKEMQMLGINHDDVSDLLVPPVFVNAEPIAYK
ncbi:MAG: hypothetical protein IJK74_06565 [Bacteroidales bacterium]|nr:hypothetical protein [Bacteroidales bacterium]